MYILSVFCIAGLTILQGIAQLQEWESRVKEQPKSLFSDASDILNKIKDDTDA
jgi:hypothetical protein